MKELQYLTYKRFSAALHRHRHHMLCWYGTDHHYVIVIRVHHHQ